MFIVYCNNNQQLTISNSNIFPKLFLLIQLIFASLSHQNIFVEGIIGQPSNLVPYIGKQNDADKAISHLLYPHFIHYNLRGELTPGVVKEWKISENGLEYEFKLNSGIYWSNNRELNVDDVIFTAQNNPATRNVEAQKINDYEVKFFLKEPYAPFLSVMTFQVLPKEVSPGLRPITLKNRKIVRVSKSGKRVNEIIIAMENNSLAKFVGFKFYDRQEDIETAANLSEIESFYSTDFKSNNYFNIDFPLKARRYGLFFNLEREELKDKNMRVTMAQVLDKVSIVGEGLDGLAEPIDFPSIQYSKEVSGNFGKELTLTVSNDEDQLKVATMIEKEWEKLGIKINILPLPFWDISTRVIDTKDFDIMLFGQEKGRDPDEYTLWHSTKTSYPGLNISQLNNQRVDQSLEEGRKEMDSAKREEHYNNFEIIFNEEVPAIFLYRPVYRWFVSKKYQNIIEEHILKASCCDGCACTEPLNPNLYYPWERFKLLPF